MMENYCMVTEVDWSQVLPECKNHVRTAIAPLLKMLNQPQPDLGVGAGGDPLKKVDLAAESALIEVLKAHKVSFTLISEESGVREYGEHASKCYVTCDPIDGTTNLVRGLPFYATSIAVSTEPYLDKVHVGLVADLFHDITYLAEKGKGAYRDGHKLVPSNNVSLEEAVIGVDLNSYKVERIAPKLTKLIAKTKHIRHFGANALELCFVADGITDAFVDIRGKLRTTDMAAAWLILREAGAVITRPDGEELTARLDPKQKVEFVASANLELHRILLGLTNSGKDTK
jgi:myo-inositol-1(or 4)-monophosphatase